MYESIHVCIHGKSILLSPQALYEVILEAVFPTSAMFLQRDSFVNHNAACLEMLSSGKAHLDLLSGVLIAGSMADGLTMEIVFGHPVPDVDLMLLLGAMLGVTIPGKRAPGSQQGMEGIPSSREASIISLINAFTELVTLSMSQKAVIDFFKLLLWSVSDNKQKPGGNIIQCLQLLSPLHPLLNETNIDAISLVFLAQEKSCLEYAPEGCPLAYTRLRGINVEENSDLYPDFFTEVNGQRWLNTRHLNQQIQKYYNMLASDPATHTIAGSGPAGQVLAHEEYV